MASYAPFFYIYVTALVGVQLLLGAVFALRARVESSRKITMLAVAYAWAAPLTVFNVMMLPGVVPSLTPSLFQAGPMSWIAWHLGWPLAIAGYAFLADGRAARLSRVPPVVLVASGLTCFVLVAGGPYLPTLVTPGTEAMLLPFRFWIAVCLVLSICVAVRMLLTAPTARNRWVLAAIVFGACESASMLLSSYRFSWEFFAARIFGLGEAFAMFGAVMSDAMQLFVRANIAERELLSAERMRVLATVGRALSQSLELDVVLDTAVTAPIPLLADWALVNLRNGDGELVLAAAHHRTPPEKAALEKMIGSSYVRPGSRGGSFAVASTTRAVRQVEVTDEFVRQTVAPEWVDTFIRLQPRSVVIVPLIVDGHMRGTLNLIYAAQSGRHYIAEDLDMLEEVGRRVAFGIENAERYAREHQVADRLQQASLPSYLPSVHGVTLDAMYQAGRSEAQIGGDWYDAFELEDGRMVISVGDVMGSGLDAAVTMGSVRQAIRGAAEVFPEPVTILNAVDRALTKTYPNAIVTAFLGIVDPVSKVLAYASAGHPPALVRWADGRVGKLEGSGLPLGLRRELMIGNEVLREVALNDEALLVLYTDGLTEADRDIDAAEARLVASLEWARDADHPAARIRDDVLGTDGSFIARDDIAILTLRLSVDLHRSRIFFSCDTSDGASATAIRHRIVESLQQRGMPQADLFNAELALGELLANVARHAGGIAEVALELGRSGAILYVADRGPGALFFPHLPSHLQESGRGLYIVSRVVRHLSSRPRAGGGSEVRAALKGISPDPWLPAKAAANGALGDGAIGATTRS